MYPPDYILAPRSRQALPPEGRLWPSDDDDDRDGDLVHSGNDNAMFIDDDDMGDGDVG